ncbi:HCNGP-like protein-domain-containing protein [Daldinia decipiens]|uniref:HCNGP-like protein-domain-containing protein n=1 Tax=Daldinia decipiens TaxID=326647 RepID=UPI0020C3EBF7|nr:HCNGP-like protein-domain-containing protein [Daldinia decipiens]KAI1660163.1 HCNGP-like protein-domain-containing protein [Daldinia decipiens]
MAGLVGYESSDDEEVVQQQPPDPKPLKQTQDTTISPDTKPDVPAEPSAASQKPDEQAAAIIGPQIGPAAAGPSFPPLEEAPLEDDSDSSPGPGLGLLPPGSPYTATRALLRDLTLPAVPNTAIPPSPPGSPPPGTSAKFERFLELKRQGVHFNSRVAQNPSLRNPALTDKLLSFVDLAAPADQYRTTLPAHIWDPAAFPRGAYREQLRLSQSEAEKARARTKGAPVDFVAAAGDGQGGVLQSASQGGGVSKASTGKRKTRFDA